jgi:hypothetical protein
MTNENKVCFVRRTVKDKGQGGGGGSISGHRLDRDGTVLLRRDKVYTELCLLFMARVATLRRKTCDIITKLIPKHMYITLAIYYVFDSKRKLVHKY